MCHSDKEQQKKLAAGTVTSDQTWGVCSASARPVKSLDGSEQPHDSGTGTV